MNKDLTELVFILDESGSMSGLESDTIGGFNSLIDKQRNDGDVVVTTVLFNTEMNIIHDRVSIKDVKKLTKDDYCPKNCTALLDAIGNTILRISKKQNELKEEYVPSKTMVIITTDGLENVSREFNYKKVKSLIDKQTELGWEFIFLGANIDSVKEAYALGISADRAVNYNCDEEGINLNYEALGDAINMVKKEKCLGVDWRSKIDDDYKKRK